MLDDFVVAYCHPRSVPDQKMWGRPVPAEYFTFNDLCSPTIPLPLSLFVSVIGLGPRPVNSSLESARCTVTEHPTASVVTVFIFSQFYVVRIRSRATTPVRYKGSLVTKLLLLSLSTLANR